jgi:hypothetical protein
MEYQEESEQPESAKEYALLPSAILRYLIGKDDEIDTLIMCRSSEVKLVTSDKAIYEALGSVKEYDDFRLPKLVKLFEVAKIQSAKEKPILTDKRVEEIRASALKTKEEAEEKDEAGEEE